MDLTLKPQKLKAGSIVGARLIKLSIVLIDTVTELAGRTKASLQGSVNLTRK